MSKKGLGKGLGALISGAGEEEKVDTGVIEVKINDIEPSFDQPRKNFDTDKLEQLAESIKKHGVVQPIIVRRENDTYKIVAGERRWRAARIAGLTTIPVVEKDLTDKQVMEIALIENIQREDLNPIEEAEAYHKLLNEFKMTQEDLSNSIGKSRSAIANTIRLLGLTQKVKEKLIEGIITSGHARALLSIDDKELQEKICDEVIDKNLTVRQVEFLVKKCLADGNSKENKSNKNENIIKEEYLKIEENLQNIFGTKVKLINKNKKGKIMIEYYSDDELDRLIELLGSIGNK
ncbi:ParB/RepB/Spo0J family partition protein [Acetivibrio mesophilus]|uniref:ParB/RepB/Spo0J family partition protein n=1 Tax=Acetivibrio mesophilus TaxID=2487273 RepID=A0A4Q0I0W7_9FIRM|nr:ParB/RepB/Spo0J family partition protein [Acetivibrio mesophilus]ODM27153.1 chromosome partitioning protein ParB [Clostridium sp. Bc-iso-3]RXE57818.1 ParB/RepB/Spo0J family partition protein [Acetivibrio mesophilus]HHV28537.1 ParB/RepB/Spo0J family partition protein [Clostridium sp.]